MKRIVLLGMAALALAIGLPSVAGASANDVSGPKCADVWAGDGSYDSTGTVNVFVFLGSEFDQVPSCPYVTYTLHVLDASGTELASVSTSGNGVDGVELSPLLLSTTVDPSNSAVCVYATTSVGRHIFDRAPDPDLSYLPKGCIDMTQSGPGSGFGSFD
jgi:hypothetical protein